MWGKNHYIGDFFQKNCANKPTEGQQTGRAYRGIRGGTNIPKRSGRTGEQIDGSWNWFRPTRGPRGPEGERRKYFREAWNLFKIVSWILDITNVKISLNQRSLKLRHYKSCYYLDNKLDW